MISVFERYSIPERLLPQDPETLRDTRFWDKHLTEKEEYWEMLNVQRRRSETAYDLRMSNELHINWNKVKHMYEYKSKK